MSARRPTGPRATPGASRPGGTGTRPTGSSTRASGPSRPGRSAGPRPAGGAGRRPGSTRPASARPAPAPGARATAPEPAPPEAAAPTITLRGLGLFIVLLVAFVVLAPTLRHAVEQQEQLRQLNADIEAEVARNEALELELEQWQDPTFVQAQARDRLGYVMPGERTFRVVDPEVVVGEEPTTEPGAGGIPAQLDAPWYLSVWESVTIAGEASDGEAPTPEPRSGD